MKTKYVTEDIEKYPLLSELDVREPELERCDVCNQPTQKVTGQEYVQYRELAKKAKDDDPDEWKKEWAWNFKGAKVLPAPEKHVICERVRRLEASKEKLRDRIGELQERFETRSTPLQRVLFKAGTLLHRLGGILQR